MEVWIHKKKLDATYRNLLKCVAGRDHEVAKAICGLKIFHEPPTASLPSQTASVPPTTQGGQAAASMFSLSLHTVKEMTVFTPSPL